jgi:hypothetical protein
LSGAGRRDRRARDAAGRDGACGNVGGADVRLLVLDYLDLPADSPMRRV